VNCCLAFVNTVRWNGAELGRDEQIIGYGQLLDWAVCEGVLTEENADRLREVAAADPDARRRALGTAWSFRRALHDCLRAVARQEAPPPASIGLLNAALTDAAPPFLIAIRSQGLALSTPSPAHPDLLQPIVRAFTRLLGSADLGRLRECEAAGCGQLYLDTTKNRSRRWCDMATCGNRAKARRHIARRRGTG
jgi:predicted RNA-binding Zn ribbon-like protein